MHENTPIVGGPAKGTGGGEGISCYFVVVHDTNQNRDMFDVGDLNPLTAVAVVEANSSPPPSPPLPRTRYTSKSIKLSGQRAGVKIEEKNRMKKIKE